MRFNILPSLTIATVRVVEHVRDVYDCAVQYGAATEVRTIRPLLLTKFHGSSRRLGREVVGSCNMDMIVLVQINSAENGTTQTGRWITTDDATVILTGCTFTELGATEAE